MYETKWICEDNTIHFESDGLVMCIDHSETAVFDTYEHAKEYAEGLWYHLTPNEQKNREIVVFGATYDDSEELELMENGDVEWYLYEDASKIGFTLGGRY